MPHARMKLGSIHGFWQKRYGQIMKMQFPCIHLMKSKTIFVRIQPETMWCSPWEPEIFTKLPSNFVFLLKSSVMATLYIVATPIGNLEDITLRALRILKEVDVVLCEDTRVTRKLLSHFGISTKTESYHSQSTFSKVEKIMGLLREGKNMALVSDSGTPTISDPGSHLLSLVEEELGEKD